MMKTQSKVLVSILLCLVLIFPAAVSAAEPANPLVMAQQQVEREFARMDAALKKAAQKLGIVGLTGEPARAVLRELCAPFPYAVDCTAINARGIMLTVEPEKYRNVEGKDISDQPQVARVLQHKTHVLSSLFRAVEGFAAMDAEYPVILPDGQPAGSVSLLFKPEALLGEIVAPLVKGLPVSIWVMNREGQILYDEDSAQVGLNIFLARLYQPYPQLIQLGQKMVDRQQGSGSYEFSTPSSPDPVRKQAQWRSASLYGAQWRLVLIHTEQHSGRKIGGPLPALQPELSLESLSKEPVLGVMIKRNDKTKIMEIFKGYYEETPGIFSIQWIDPQGINRFGYPIENSLTDYHFRNGRRAEDYRFVKAVEERRPIQIEAPMFEGMQGRFVLRPVFRRGEYLGMIYIIQVR